MFGFRRKTVRQGNDLELDALIDRLKDLVRLEVGQMIAIHTQRERDERTRTQNLVHEAQDDVGEIRTTFKEFEQGVYAEIRTLCQNAAEATRAIADAMEILRPTLMKIRERNLKKEAAEKCPKE